MRIVFEDVCVEFPGQRALDGVSGELASGSVTAVIGPSGAGKSSLLGVLAGLVQPVRGVVRFDDDDVSAWPAERRRLGVVFQDARLFDFLSGRENVGFAPRVAGVAPDEERRRVDAALALVRAAGFADRPARSLSGGERQRIALARALAMQPRALLLDEPFAALDAELRRTLRSELRELVRALGLTVLLITHDREDAFALASRLIVIRDGKVTQAGDAAELYQRPATPFVATLLGEATVLPIEARDGDRALVLGQWINAAGAGGHLILRPEDIAIADSGPGWPASLVEARFVGHTWRLVLALPDGARLVVAAERVPSTTVVAIPKRPVHCC